MEREFIAICSSHGSRQTCIKKFTDSTFRKFMLLDCERGEPNITQKCWVRWIKDYKSKIQTTPIKELFEYLMSHDVKNFSIDDGCFWVLEGIVQDGIIVTK